MIYMSVSSRRKKYPLYKIVIHIFLILASVVSLFPLVWMFRSALMNSTEIFIMPMRWLPEKVLWSNFKEALTAEPFLQYGINTMIIVVLNIIGNVFSSTFAAFGFSRLNFKGRDVIFTCLIATMMIPSTVLLIPQFIGWQTMGFYNTYVPLILPAFFFNAFYTFMMKQFFMNIPKEYDESALIDGASYPRIYASILIPLSKPAITTVVVFTFMGTWNDFFGPLIYLSEDSKYTLALGLQSFIGQYVSKWNLMMAASTVVVVPMIILFFFAQKAFIQGIAFSGVKG